MTRQGSVGEKEDNVSVSLWLIVLLLSGSLSL